MAYLRRSRGTATKSISTAQMQDDAVTLAKMAGGTDGNVITYDASGNPAVVASGTSGQFLKSQGAGSVPVFAAAAAPSYDTDFPFTSTTQNFGKMRLITGQTNSAASASYFNASGLYYTTVTVSYSGYSATPKTFATIGGGSHETGVGGYYQENTSNTKIYLNSRVETQVESQAVWWVVIGTAS